MKKILLVPLLFVCSCAQMQEAFGMKEQKRYCGKVTGKCYRSEEIAKQKDEEALNKYCAVYPFGLGYHPPVDIALSYRHTGLVETPADRWKNICMDVIGKDGVENKEKENYLNKQCFSLVDKYQTNKYQHKTIEDYFKDIENSVYTNKKNTVPYKERASRLYDFMEKYCVNKCSKTLLDESKCDIDIKEHELTKEFMKALKDYSK